MHDGELTEVALGDGCYDVFCNGEFIGNYCKNFARVRPNTQLNY
jgi:hypothetical protein